MPLITKFCFWFSTRLGTAIVGVLTLIQATIWLMIYLIGLYNLEQIRNDLQSLIDNLSLRSKFFSNLADDPRIYLILMTIYFSLVILACILSLYGAFKCKRRFVLPFIILNPLYVIYILSNHIVLMILLKRKEISLGALIFYSNVGGFLCMYLLYMWTSVVSFYQILRELDMHSEQQIFQSRSDPAVIPVRTNYIKY